MLIKKLGLFSLLFVALQSEIRAAELRVGFEAPLSGPLGLTGQEMQRGLDFALEKLGGKIGGLDTKVIVADSKGDPSVGTQELSRLIEKEKINVLTGLGASNVSLAVANAAAEANVMVLVSHSGPAALAGKQCHPNLFLFGFQNDQWNVRLGSYLNEKGVKRLYTMGLDYQAGWEYIAGATRDFKGDVVGKTLTPLSQVDFAGEFAQVRAANPDAIFAFYPGAAAVAFLKQYAQSGLKIPLYGVGMADSSMLWKAQGSAAIGGISTTVWSPALDNPENKTFVEAFNKKYGRVPTTYSALVYDTIMFLDAAVRGHNVDPADHAAFRKALLNTGTFRSVRGDISFGKNQVVIQPMLIQQTIKDTEGNTALKLLASIPNDPSAYVKDCPTAH